MIIPGPVALPPIAHLGEAAVRHPWVAGIVLGLLLVTGLRGTRRAAPLAAGLRADEAGDRRP